MRNLYYQRGQTGLLVLLIMTVVLTIGVSVATRSVSEIKTSRQEEDSTKAFNRAEEGIEEMLGDSNLSQGPYTLTNGAVGHVEDIHQVDLTLNVGEVLELSLVDGETLDIIVSTTCGTADGAVVVTKFNDGTSDNLVRQGFDPCRTKAFGFSDTLASGQIPTITGSSGDSMVRIRAIRGPVDISATSPNIAQGFKIRAQDESTADDVARAVQVDKYNPSLPNVFDYALFSGSSITH